MRLLPVLSVCLSALLLGACQPAANQSPAAPQAASATTPDAAPAANPAPSPDCHFTIGFDAWEPYQYIDVGNEVSGLDIEIARQLLDNMNCTATFRAGTWVALLSELRSGQVDILLGASQTPARQEFAFFSEPYRTEQYSLYVRKDELADMSYASVASFIEDGKRVGVVEDYYYGPQVSMLRDGIATTKYFVSAIIGELNIARLLDKNIDGFLDDTYVGAAFIRRKALGDYIAAQGLIIDSGDAHFMFSKQSVSPEQVAAFNQALQQAKANHELEAIFGRYRQ